MTATTKPNASLEILTLVGFVALCWAVAITGSWATMPAIPGWYAQLDKPAWTPPNWLFGPVWSILYTLMGVAAWLVWRREGWGAALLMFFVQLTFNAAWSPLFFGAHLIGVALIDIALLWLSLAATLVLAWRVNTLAGVLLVPYLVWVSYATALNAALWWMNG